LSIGGGAAAAGVLFGAGRSGPLIPHADTFATIAATTPAHRQRRIDPRASAALRRADWRNIAVES
jgi:hypothetical protein